MKTEEKIELIQQDIWQAIEDYSKYCKRENTVDNVSKEFVDRLAEDSIKAKKELREMFRRSSAWNEDLDSLVIDGTWTHNTDYDIVEDLGYNILRPVLFPLSERRELVKKAISFFTRPDENCPAAINALKELAPKAYVSGKKKSRIFKDLCKSLGVVDERADSKFQRQYAKLTDELSAKKIDFKLFVSLNPAHFITMSNPKGDSRGSMLISCHSFNDRETKFNNGCTGYARDEVTMIAFTVSDPDNPETLNNRKTTRQLFMYRPGNGLLLQSRLYNTFGGTEGRQIESKIYRKLIQKEISECEDAANSWKTFKYCNNRYDIACDIGFGGYIDWVIKEFNATISIRNDCAKMHKTFTVGSYGLCVTCGKEISRGLYCRSCESKNCNECGEHFNVDQTSTAYNNRGEEVTVCDDCLDKHYVSCDYCHENYHKDYTRKKLDNGDYVCLDCSKRYYQECSKCGKLTYNQDLKDGLCLSCHP